MAHLVGKFKGLFKKKLFYKQIVLKLLSQNSKVLLLLHPKKIYGYANHIMIEIYDCIQKLVWLQTKITIISFNPFII